MTPQQEARLLRARARTLRAQASYLWVREPLLDKVCCEEADACDAVAAELEARAERETKEALPREPRDEADSCPDFSTWGMPSPCCPGDGHYRCKKCVHFEARKATCCGRHLGPGETCGACTDQKKE